LEEKIDKIDLKMESNSDDYVLLQDLVREKEVLDKALLEKYERWEYLNELSDKIKNRE
jgi:ATP-binding cassette subfamily F protein uup